MQVDDLRGTGHLMEVVHVLRDNRHVVLLLQLSHQPVPLIGFHTPALLAEHIIEIGHECRISLPAFVGGHLCHGIVLPKTIGIAESLQSALHRHACTC